MATRDWIPWHGGECPVLPDTLVVIKFREGRISDEIVNANRLDWRHTNSRFDIVAFRLCTSAQTSTNTDRDQIAKLGAHEPASVPDTLSVRDHFAMAALTGMLACWTIETEPNQGWAIDAYRIADAMMKERSK